VLEQTSASSYFLNTHTAPHAGMIDICPINLWVGSSRVKLVWFGSSPVGSGCECCQKGSGDWRRRSIHGGVRYEEGNLQVRGATRLQCTTSEQHFR